MRIKFHKSEVVPLNLKEEVVHNTAHILGCPVSSLPMKYLGVPLHFDKLRRVDIQPIVDKISKGLLVGEVDFSLIVGD